MRMLQKSNFHDILIITSLITFSLTGFPVHSDVTRGCEGRIIIKELNTKDIDMVILDTFEGRGACKNSSQGNKCRQRARDNILRCGKEIWVDRWNLIGNPNDQLNDHVLPAICRGEHTGVRKLGFKTNPYGRATDIKYAIDYAACCQMKPRQSVVHVTPFVVSDGAKGCGLKNERPASDSLWDDYEVNCSRLRVQGLCGAPTGRTQTGPRKE